MQQWTARGLRLAVFGAVVVGAVAFVLHTRKTELEVSGTPRLSTTNKQAAVQGYYILFRLSRQRAEAQEEALMRGILANRSLPAADHVRAAKDLATIATDAREETEVEQLLASQGFPQSAVVLSNRQAMVVVPQSGMNDSKALQIGTDLWHLAGIEPQNVLIRPRP